jgi:hypothetical protein
MTDASVRAGRRCSRAATTIVSGAIRRVPARRRRTAPTPCGEAGDFG